MVFQSLQSTLIQNSTRAGVSYTARAGFNELVFLYVRSPGPSSRQLARLIADSPAVLPVLRLCCRLSGCVAGLLPGFVAGSLLSSQ